MTGSVMVEAYRRAREWLPAVAARRTAGNAVDGYWLDDRYYFFLAEALDPATDRVLDTPSLADARTGVVRVVTTPEQVFDLLRSSGFEGAPADLADAHYDMPSLDRIAVTLAGRTWMLDPRLGRVVASESSAASALYSPDGRLAVVIDGDNLALRDRLTQATLRLTESGVADAPVGQHPQTGTSPVSYRRSPTPLGVWSSDSRWFLTHQIDERALGEAVIVDAVPAGSSRPVAHRFRAPPPYGPLPQVTLLAIEVASGTVVASTPFEMAVYAPVLQKTAWFAAPGLVCYLRSDRHLRRYELIALDLATGAERVLVREVTDHGYLEMHPLIGWPPNVRVLPEADEAIWWSERDGWGHLYLYDTLTGAVKRQLTCGAWQVRDIVHVDVAGRRVLLTRCGRDAVDYQNRELCSVGLDGDALEVLISCPGRDVAVRAEPIVPAGQDWPFRPSRVSPSVSPSGRYVVARITDSEVGNQTEIADLGDGRRVVITGNDPAFAAWPVPPLALNVRAADGDTALRAMLFRPSDFDPARRYPLLDLFYPGPQLVFLPRSFNSRIQFLAQSLAEIGCVVLVSDSRALPFRSRALHQAGYPQTIEPQLADQAAVIKQLCRDHPFIDEQRVGVLGFSAGASGAVQALLDYPDLFHVGVAINGNYDLENVIAVWPNKYVGPAAADVIAEQDLTRRAGRLHGKLLLVAAGMDENVNIVNTFRLVEALAQTHRDFELLVRPSQGHVMMLTDGYTVRRVFDFLARTLIGTEPPDHFEIRFAPHQLARMGKASGLDALWT